EQIKTQARWRRKCVQGRREHPRHVQTSLGYGASGLKPSNAKVTEVSQKCFVGIQLQRQDQRQIRQIEKMEIPRQHADDLTNHSVHDDRFADRGWISAKVSLPVAIGEARGRWRARSVI